MSTDTHIAEHGEKEGDRTNIFTKTLISAVSVYHPLQLSLPLKGPLIMRVSLMPGKPNSSLTASLGEEGRERAQRERKTQGETEQHRGQRQRERERERCAHTNIYTYTPIHSYSSYRPTHMYKRANFPWLQGPPSHWSGPSSREELGLEKIREFSKGIAVFLASATAKARCIIVVNEIMRCNL